MKSLEELKAIRERMQGEIGVRKADANETRVVVGMATCGIASGARPVLNRLAELVREKGLNDVIVTQAGCIGLCQYEPIVEVFAPGKEKVTYIQDDAGESGRSGRTASDEGLDPGQVHPAECESVSGGVKKRCIVHMYWSAAARAVRPAAARK